MLSLKTVYRRRRRYQLEMMMSRALGICSWILIVLGSSTWACRLLLEALLDKLRFDDTFVEGMMMSSCSLLTMLRA